MNVFLKSKREIAEGTVWFEFESGDDGLSYMPGQYASLKLALKYPDDKGPERYFSIVNPPDSGSVEFATRISETGFKETLSAMKDGDPAEITRIGGTFLLPENADKEIVMVAGGVGITPFKCMLEDLVLNEEKRNITLLYSNKNKTNAAFYDELAGMEQEGYLTKVFFVMTRDDTWPGPKGRMNADFIADNVPEYREKHFMVAGPPNFVGGISQALEELKIGDVKLEKFFGY